MSANGERQPGSFVIGGRAYPALLVGEHDGEPYARLPLENGLVVEAYGWIDSDDISLFLVEDGAGGDDEPDLCWTEVVSSGDGVATIAEWSRWTKAAARQWRRAPLRGFGAGGVLSRFAFVLADLGGVDGRRNRAERTGPPLRLSRGLVDDELLDFGEARRLHL